MDAFVALLDRWQAKTNLVASSSLSAVWTRHVADSLQLLPLAPPDARIWVDLGSGGGFPGIPLAASLKRRLGAHIHLVESVGRKAAFLREAIRLLHLPATVHNCRIEELPLGGIGRVDVLTARALAPLPELFTLAAPLMTGHTTGLFLKGQDVEAELADATRYWDYSSDLVPSVTDDRARVVRLGALQRKAGRT